MKPLTRKCLRLGSRIFRKAGLDPAAIAGVLCSFPHKMLKTTDEDIARASQLMRDVHDDYDNSCAIAEKEVSSDYDLHIIIPAYNVEKYIVGCMESAIAAQNRGKYKILVTVINDGSTDATAELLKQYEGRKDVEIIHQKNRGLSGARNTGLENIRGRYVTFVDSDDELGDICSLLDEAIKADADIAEGSYEKFNGTSSTYIRGGDVDSDNGGYGILYGYAWGKLYRNTLFKNIRFPESYWFEDTLNGLVLFHLARKVIKRDIPVYRYRINPQGITSTAYGRPKSCDSHWITERLMKDRALLGLDNDNDTAALMLAEQIRMNYFRISKMRRDDLDRALFVLSRDLYDRYIPAERLMGNPLAAALRSGDYLKFRLLSILTM